MDFGFLKDPDTTRYCYLRLRRLKEASKNPAILDAVMEELEVPSDGAGGRSTRKKLAAIEGQIDALRGDKTSTWYGVPAPEVLAAAIFSARTRAAGAADHLFSEAAGKEGLAPAIIRWLSLSGFAPFTQIPPGVPRVDLVTYHAAGLLAKPRVVGVELLEGASQLQGALDRMRACAELTNAMYLACTPATAADILLEHAAQPNILHWDAAMLRKKLAVAGFGLLLVEGDAVSEALAPKERNLDPQTAISLLRPR